MSEPRKLIIPRPITRTTTPVIELDPSKTEGLYHAALQIAKEREELLKQLKVAYLDQDTENLYRIAAKLCGLE